MSDLNDPRVFFAAERTLLAWNRTSLTLMAFGFVIERFGLVLQIFAHETGQFSSAQGALSSWVGTAFVLLGAAVALLSTVQYKRVIKTLKPVEIPEGYWINIGVFANLTVAILGTLLVVYFLGDFHNSHPN